MDEQPASTPLRSASRFDSFRHAFRGWRYTLRTQRNTWIHALFSVGAVAMGVALRLTRLEWALLVFAIGLVWVAEFANTALEAVVNLISPEYHPLAGVSKDVAAAGVLVSAGTAVVIGCLIFVPPLVELWQTRLWPLLSTLR